MPKQSTPYSKTGERAIEGFIVGSNVIITDTDRVEVGFVEETFFRMSRFLVTLPNSFTDPYPLSGPA